MRDIRLEDEGWLAHNSYKGGKTIVIENVLGWIESLIAMTLTHETLHFVIEELEGNEASVRFDNLFGFVDSNVLLCPQEYNDFFSIQLKRLKMRRGWKKLCE